jgi:hypothetical protein
MLHFSFPGDRAEAGIVKRKSLSRARTYYIRQIRSEQDENTLSVEADCIVKTAIPLRNVLQSFYHVQDSLSSVFATEAVLRTHLCINAGASFDSLSFMSMVSTNA